jgi:hypothetical protein
MPSFQETIATPRLGVDRGDCCLRPGQKVTIALYQHFASIAASNIELEGLARRTQI